MADKEVSTGLKKFLELIDDPSARFYIKVDHDIATEDNVERSFKRIRKVNKIKFLKEEMFS